MIEKEIIEGNKLIAEFMGKTQRYERTEEIFLEQLKYHCSWDWLMPVVEKINNIDTPLGKMDVVIWKSDCHIQDIRQIFIEKSKKNSLIECVWEAVIEFIQWYNQNK